MSAENLTTSPTNSAANGDCCPASCSALWRDLGDNGWRAEHDEGDFTGAVVTTAQVVQGGNGRWTPWVARCAKGRLKKVGQGRIAGKTLAHHYPGQFPTKQEAFDWADSKWAEISAQNGAVEAQNVKDNRASNDSHKPITDDN